VGYAPVSNTRDNPPCNTLFVGNLGFDVQEADLHSLFGAQPVGFSRDVDSGVLEPEHTTRLRE
jgi:hypothetical protein